MRSRLAALQSRRSGRALDLFEALEASASGLGAVELLDALGQAARLKAVLVARYTALAASPVAPLPSASEGAARYLDAMAAAKYLGVSKSTVVRLAKAGTLPSCHPSSGTVRFDRYVLDAYMARAR